MSLPWVSRTTFEMALTVSKLAHEEAQVWRRQYQDLLAKYHQLRLQGQTAPEPTPEPPARREVDPVIAAINEKTANDPRLRAAALAQLAQDRQLGKSNEDILRSIYTGMSVFEDEGTPI